jgi:hypothetical protein
MHIPRDLQFDTETFLLFSIWYLAKGPLDKDKTATAYLKDYEKDIRGTGQVLEWLGLARPDKKSALGWKPSHDLMSLIAEPRRLSKSKKECADFEDDEVFDIIFDATIGEHEEWGFHDFVVSVLRFLGLAKEADDDFVPTSHLRFLVFQRRQVARLQKLMATA